MSFADAQRRRNRGTDMQEEPLLEQNANSSTDNSKLTLSLKMVRSFLRRVKIQNLVIATIAILVVLKLILVLSSSEPVVELTPPGGKVEKPKWKYTNNPQGVTEKGFNELMNMINSGKDLDFSRPLEQKEEDSIPIIKNLPLPKLPSVYESKGSLKFKGGKFILDGKPLRILSGAMHYFRVMPEYWTDRMRKMKACGLNTLETYVSWNLHEESPGQFNFDGILDIKQYIETAQKEGLHVILRPGPFICSEWDFGGLPAWLLKDDKMKVRTNYQTYKEAVTRFFGKLLPLVKDLQYSKGGPIIAFQIENEFGSYSNELDHLKFIKEVMIENGVEELFLTSDGITGHTTGMHVAPFYNEALPTVNFMKYRLGKVLFDHVRQASPDFPLMVMEFWAGWFDHWGRNHAYSNTKYFAWDLEHILKAGASVNFYMFHGGTNFGFMAGANWFNFSSYNPDTTSYDYIAPLNEAGDITPKYEVIRALIKKHVLDPEASGDLPDIPPDTLKGNYGEVRIDKYMTLEDVIIPVKKVQSRRPVAMEMLNLGNGYGQNHGFTLYRAIVNKGDKLKFTSPAYDRAQVLLNGIEVGQFNWVSQFWELVIPSGRMFDQHNILDILIENHGRVNFVLQGFNRFNEERKGLNNDVLIDGQPVENWDIYPLQFKPAEIEKYMQSRQWQIYANKKGRASLYMGTLKINGTPRDTFLNMKGWKKGVAFINGFNLGRYWDEGPQKTLYVPAPVLKTGENKVVIFELHKPSHAVVFDNVPILG